MKRWPIGLAVIGTLIALVIGFCSEGDPKPSAPAESANVVLAPAPVPSPPAPELDALSTQDPAKGSDAATRSAVVSVSDSPSLIIDVLWSDDTPVANVRFVFARGETVLETHFVERGGRLSLPPLGRDVDVLVLAQLSLLVRHHFDNAIGQYVLRVPAGVTLRGTVLVDGAPPTESLSIALVSRDEDVGVEPPPTFVQRQVDLRGYQGKPIRTASTDAKGRFEFRDLPATWTGTLDNWDWFEWEDAHPMLVTDPSREVLIRLRSPPMIRGRIVMPDTSSPAPDAYGTYDAKCTDGEASGELRSELDGRFRIRMPCHGLTKFLATVGLAGVGRATFELHDVPSSGIDVGDVVLEAARDVYFVVQDASGKPIEGAVVATFDEMPIVSGPTDSNGRGTLSAVPESIDLVRVRALGYAALTRGLGSEAGTAIAPVAITLERLPHLTIIVERQGGEPARDVLVRLHGRGNPPFLEESGRPSFRDRRPFLKEDGDGSRPIQVDLGAPQPGSRISRSTGGSLSNYEFVYRVDDEGQLSIPGLSVEAQFSARIEDITGAVLAERNVEPSWITSGTPLRIVVEGAPRTLELLVLDEKRQPLRGARVSASDVGSATFGEALIATTLSDGIAGIQPIYAQRFGLRVELAGFVPFRLDEVVLTHAFERREVILTLGQSVHVRVVDSTGAALAADGVEAKVESHKVGKVTRCVIDDECFRIDDLPQSMVEIGAFAGGVRFAKGHDPRERDVVIEIPEHGSVLFEFSEPLSSSGRLVVMLAPEPAADGAPSENAEIMRMVPREPPATSFELPVVFPGRYTAQVKETNLADGAAPLQCRVSDVVVRAGERCVVRARLSR